jgi:molecular chaperone GrpE
MNQESENKVEQGSEAVFEKESDSAPEGSKPEEILVGEILEDASEDQKDSEDADESEESLEIPKSGSEEQEEEASAQPSLEALYEEAVAKAESNRNDYLRSVADMQNLRKRTSRDVQQARSFAIEGFARDLLPVADNMIRALSALGESDDPAIKSLREGVEMVQKEMDRAFDKHGLVKIEALNTPFDPNLHQAVVQMDSPDSEPGHVVQEMQVGYTLNDRLLRPAMVGVSKG